MTFRLQGTVPSTSTPGLHLVTLGGLGLELDGGPSDLLASQRKVLALLAVVAAHGPRGISRDKLVGLLWPDSPDDSVRNALAQLLHRVRRDVGAEAIAGTTDLRLNDTVLTCDIEAFKASIAKRDMQTAVSLYRGDFLDGVQLRLGAEFELWADAERRTLRNSCGRALDQLARDARARHDASGFVNSARRRADLDPLNASAALQFMDALAEAGEREAAIRHAMAYAALVRAELEATPDQAVMKRADALRALEGGTSVPGFLTTFNAHPANAEQAAPSAGTTQPPSPSKPATTPRWRRRASTGLVIAGFAAVAVIAMTRDVPLGAVGSVPSSGAAIARPTAEVRIHRATTSPFVRGNGSVSRDGRYFYAGTGDNARQLTRVELSSGRVDTLARFDGAIDNVRVSPDGKTIAATVWVEVLPTERQSFDGASLWTVDTDGANRRMLARPQFVASFQAVDWTPDSKRILVLAQRDSGQASSFNGDAYAALLSVRDGTMQRVAEMGPASPWRMRMSPDGRYIAYTDRRLTDARTTVRVIDVVTGARAGLVPAVGNEQLLDWTPDGAVLFTRDVGPTKSVWLQRVVDGRAVGSAQVMNADIPPIQPVGMTADGQLHYLMNDEGPAVIVVNVDSATHRVAAPAPVDLRASEGTAGGVYSPDGKYLAFAARHGNATLPGTVSLILQTVDGAEIREIPLAMAQPLIVNWTQDGRSVLVRGEGQLESQGRLIDVATGRINVASRYSEPAWITLGRPVILNDGSVLRGLRDTSAADRWEDADNIIARFDQVTGRDQVIARIARMVRTVPAPDGKAFVAVVQDSGRQTLRLYSIAGGRVSFVRQLAPLSARHTGRAATAAIWGPDGRSVIVSIDDQVGDAPATTRVMRYPLSGAAAEHLFDIPDRAILNSVHPDGRRFAFLRQARASLELWAMETRVKSPGQTR